VAIINVCKFEFKITFAPEKFAFWSTEPETVLGTLTLNDGNLYMYKATFIERKFM